jgi:hypothetical protein
MIWFLYITPMYEQVIFWRNSLQRQHVLSDILPRNVIFRIHIQLVDTFLENPLLEEHQQGHRSNVVNEVCRLVGGNRT